ncbi:hypothetical protein [Streptomyces sp. NPDC056431]|uniref:hypothetical protein n=1 Tax=Streptomyces sp. NPDC056431 TaxID=3345814 RepID=UPI00369DC876
MRIPLRDTAAVAAGVLDTWWTYSWASRKPAVQARRRLGRLSREQLQPARRPRAAMSAVSPATQARARC